MLSVRNHIKNPSRVPTQNEQPTALPLGTDKVNDSQAKAIDWTGICARIQNCDNAATEELYGIFSKGIRYYFCRQVGPQDLDDNLHDTFMIVVQAIQRGDVREPERLMGFIRTIVRRQVAAYIDKMVHSRSEEVALDIAAPIANRHRNPEQLLVAQQHAAIMKSALEQLPSREREILVRFYVREEPLEQICEEMNLTETQFRLSKSRAKARFGEIGKKKLRPSVALFMGASA
jgi:RNA polymerase sigma-70 factor (ECF subfamily)